MVLARVGNLELVARAVVDGFINGLHRSPHFGASVDFAEHRGYTPGDDIRRVDWKLFGRTDRFYIKEYEADTNANFAVPARRVEVDGASAAAGITKLEYGQLLAGCLTYMVHRQRDRVGFAAFDDDVVEYVPPSAKHMDTTLHVLDRLKPSKAGQLAPPMKKLAEHFSRRGLLVLVSDFYEDPQAVLEAVAPLRFRGPRHDRVSPARSGGDRVHLRPGVGVRGPGERRADPGRARGAGGAVPRADHASTADALRSKFSELRIDYALLNTRPRRSIRRCSATCRCANR